MKAEWTNKDSLSIESTGQKAILVINEPSSCWDCRFDHFHMCMATKERKNNDGHTNSRPSWCPLIPKRIGRWIGKPIAGYSTIKCSCCGSTFLENAGRWNYCPNCGVEMGETE